MMENYLLLLAAAFYLLGILSIFLGPRLRKWIWACGSIVFALVLSVIALLTQFTLFSEAVKVEITNYSSSSGLLYFLRNKQEGPQILYELAVNANEESQLEVADEDGDYDVVILLSKDEIMQVPVQTQAYGQLEIWEKELAPADPSYRKLLQEWQQRQQRYSLAIGLMLFWFLLYIIYLNLGKKRRPATGAAREHHLSAREL